MFSRHDNTNRSCYSLSSALRRVSRQMSDERIFLKSSTIAFILIYAQMILGRIISNRGFVYFPFHTALAGVTMVVLAAIFLRVWSQKRKGNLIWRQLPLTSLLLTAVQGPIGLGLLGIENNELLLIHVALGGLAFLASLAFFTVAVLDSYRNGQ